MSDAPPSRGLDAYRKKRSPGATPEPLGELTAQRPGLFVVQKHAARNLHYDLRLEIGGVLASWAVPKGPSLDPSEKRWAIATEDHPVEYGEFEGVIPPGNYGAGAVIVWDRGLAIHHLDPEEGLAGDKLLFELKGYKLRGLFTLVRTKGGGGKEWLLIKKPDAWATKEDVADLAPESVFSGLTVEEMAAGSGRAAEIRQQLEGLEARRHGPLAADDVELMLAELKAEPFSKAGWLFEIKYDGYRLLAAKGRHGAGRREVRLSSRNHLDLTVTFPDLARALAALPYDHLLLDGEVTVLDDLARPSFQLLQKRAKISRPLDAEAAAVHLPAAYFAFDLLGFEDFDLRSLPLVRRKEILRQVLPATGPLKFADHVEGRGKELFSEVEKMGLEGLMAKKQDAPYRGGRHPTWLKLRADRSGDFVVVGLKLPDKGSRTAFRALHLGVLVGGHLLHVGSVGSGFSEAQLRHLARQLEPLRRPDPPFAGEAPRGDLHVWVEPRLVLEVKFTEYTDAGHLRHPVFLRLRTDKRPEDCIREDVPAVPEEAAAEPASPPPEVRFTHPDKIFWPDDGYTKGDLINYYRAVAPFLLPYLRDRPVVLDRYPDGIDGKSFFQKHAPDFAPEWLRVESVWSQDSGEESRVFVCDDEPSLLWLANLGTIPLHIWASRFQDLGRPDWCVLDLDAKEVPFPQVIEVAQTIHRLAEDIELPAFPKTSGGTGLHVLVPLGGQCTFEQARQLGELLARIVVQELPETASIARLPQAREGKVYVDFLQNGYGKLLVSPFSARPRPGGPVSMPLSWDEVAPGLDPADFHLGNAPERLRGLGEDFLAEVLDLAPDLPLALGRLAERMEP